MELSATGFDLSTFEDPVKYEPYTDAIRCPHDPGHVYERGTLLKKNMNGREFWQCSLTTEWFPANEFTKDTFVDEATQKCHEVNKLYINEKQKNRAFTTENTQLKKIIVDLTEELRLERENSKTMKDLFMEELKKNHDKYEKNVNSLNEIIKKNEKFINTQKIGYEKLIQEIRADMEKRRKSLEDRLIDEKKSHPKIPEGDIAYRIAITIVSIGAILWSSKKLIDRVREAYDT